MYISRYTCNKYLEISMRENNYFNADKTKAQRRAILYFKFSTQKEREIISLLLNFASSLLLSQRKFRFSTHKYVSKLA